MQTFVDLQQEIESALRRSVLAMEPVGGGDFAAAFRCELADGTLAFAKTHSNPPERTFSTEATSLQWLAEAGGRVPTVLATSDDEPPHLVLSWIQPGRTTKEGDAEFGRMLAAVHRQPFACFGRPDSRRTGSQGLPNEQCLSWAEHYATQRLLPLARLGHDTGTLAPRTIAGIETLVDSLDSFAGPTERPSLLHGDLWAGNRVVDSHGLSWMVDPASFGGHREFDLAMMRLFGGYGADSFHAYNEVFPLAEGWEKRITLHQVAPLVVHAIKFGGHYVGSTNDALDSLLTFRRRSKLA